MQRRSLFLSLVDVSHDLVVLYLAVMWSLVRLVTEVIANIDGFQLRSVCLQELVIDVLVDVYSCSGMTLYDRVISASFLKHRLE